MLLTANTGYPVIVGAGGAGRSGSNGDGVSGGTSSGFGQSVGGGRGGTGYDHDGGCGYGHGTGTNPGGLWEDNSGRGGNGGYTVGYEASDGKSGIVIIRRHIA